jgi:hypothetical protein
MLGELEHRAWPELIEGEGAAVLAIEGRGRQWIFWRWLKLLVFGGNVLVRCGDWFLGLQEISLSRRRRDAEEEEENDG